MSAHTKKHHTSHKATNILYVKYQGNIYAIPVYIAEKYKINQNSDETVPAESVFSSLDEKYGKPGSLLRGLRYREGLSQEKFAEMVKVKQPELSKMENGKRPIGKTIAKRIAEIFDVDYRSFL